MYRSLILLPLLAAFLAGCKPENKFQPPPPPQISVALPLKQEVTPYEELTGNTVAFNTVDLVARVEGFLISQNYVDGSVMKKGDTLFVIEQTMYKAQVKEAEAQLDGAKAKLVVVDASRRNPYERRFRSYSHGLAPIGTPDNALILSSASPGKVVDDGKGEHSTLVGELLNHLNAQGTAESVFNKTRVAISRASEGDQVPTVSSSLLEDVNFSEAGG